MRDGTVSPIARKPRERYLYVGSHGRSLRLTRMDDTRLRFRPPPTLETSVRLLLSTVYLLLPP
ncbi:hypothetical protein K523DRAFT_323102 [Schizophyllum commune Tattone D]|nr:hypothetical protein K523DRAFT_323102 [Schizophyllum commune Tattone D]